MIEKRRQIRHRMPCLIAVLDRDTRTFLGELANISRDGLMLLTRMPLEIDRTYRLRVELPDHICGRGDLLIEAAVVWSHPAARPPFHHVGLAALHPERTNQEIIRLLVEDAVYQRWIS